MSKGELTRGRILDAAMRLASGSGLDGLTIGLLSDKLSLSKSGLFAHFGSKEALQLAVLEHTRARFVEHVEPYVRSTTKGLATLRAYVRAWLDWIASPHLPAGCPILGATFELEAREGATRDYIVNLQRASRERLATMVQDAIAVGELPNATDVTQFIFELRGITLAFHQELHLADNTSARTHADRAIAALIERWATTGRTARRSPRKAAK
jgi:AcrR family transcriptional regulator